MKSKIITLFLLLLPFAGHADISGVSSAQKKYDAGDFSGAIALYNQEAKINPNNASLLYNLGNAYFRGGDLGLAVASYQKAFDLKPRDSDIRYNLDFALRKAGEELVPAGVPPLMYDLFHLFSQKELAGLQWIFCWLSLVFGAIIFLKIKISEQLKPFVLPAVGLWALFGFWWLARYEIDPSPLAVIISPNADIRSGPGNNFNVTFTAPEGRRVEILSEGSGWLEIGTVKEGSRGWIDLSAVQKI